MSDFQHRLNTFTGKAGGRWAVLCKAYGGARYWRNLIDSKWSDKEWTWPWIIELNGHPFVIVEVETLEPLCFRVSLPEGQ